MASPAYSALTVSASGIPDKLLIGLFENPGQTWMKNRGVPATTDAGGGYNVGWIGAGEWLAYDDTVAESRNYALTLRMASAVTGTKTAIISVDGVAIATFNFSGNSGWQAWSSMTVKKLRLTAGNPTLRIGMATPNLSVNWLDVTPN